MNVSKSQSLRKSGQLLQERHTLHQQERHTRLNPFVSQVNYYGFGASPDGLVADTVSIPS